MDPALVDRSVTHLAGVDDAGLPTRPMTIAGIEGALEARILSTDLSGASTRLVRLRSGWGSGLPGAFTAEVELLVVQGALEVGPEVLEAGDYLAIPGRRVVPRVRVVADGTALLMTSAPVRYEVSAPGPAAELSPGRAAELEWEPVPEMPGRHTKRLGQGPAGTVWLAGAREWDHSDGPWHRHPHHEECFVMDGEITLVDQVDGVAVTHLARAGAYFFRPAGILHAGPGSGCGDTAVVFHRAHGDLDTEWVRSPGENAPESRTD